MIKCLDKSLIEGDEQSLIGGYDDSTLVEGWGGGWGGDKKEQSKI